MAFRRSIWNTFATAFATRRTTKTHNTNSGLQVSELTLKCSDGLKLAAQYWKAPFVASPLVPTNEWISDGQRTVVCVHGWLDNCRSFYQLAPYLAKYNYNVVALDLPGHGRSAHKSVDAPPMVQAEQAFYLSEALEQLDHQGLPMPDGKVTLIGHSLGAGISSLYASSFPEHVEQLVLLDGAGFLARRAEDTSMHVRNHIRRRKIVQKSRKRQDRGYPSLDAAIQRHLQSVQAMPGNQTLSYEAARELVLRATHLDRTHINQIRAPITFRHDPRYSWPSIQYMTQEQNEGIFSTLAPIDTCILLATLGYPFQQDLINRATKLIQPRTIRTLPGSHYFHADPESFEEVAHAILKFLSKPPTSDTVPFKIN